MTDTKTYYFNDKEKKTQFFINNQNLIYDFIKRNKKYVFLFDTMEDMIQELSLKTWQSLDTYNEDKNKISTYINKTLENYCKNKIRYLNRQHGIIFLKCVPFSEIQDETLENRIPDNFNVWEDMVDKDEWNTISDISKEVIKGKTYKEIQKQYNISIKKLKKTVLEDIEKIKER